MSAVLRMMTALVTVLGRSRSSAAAATPQIGSFPEWDKTAPGTFDAVFSTASAFPATHAVTTNAGASLASGKSAFPGARTGFGQTFGSTHLQSYLTIVSLGTSASSTSTETFTAAPLASRSAMRQLGAPVR